MVSRKDDVVVVQRPPRPLQPRGFAVRRPGVNMKISAIQACDYKWVGLALSMFISVSTHVNTQRRWLRAFWEGKTSKKLNVSSASQLMAMAIGEEFALSATQIKVWQQRREVDIVSYIIT